MQTKIPTWDCMKCWQGKAVLDTQVSSQVQIDQSFPQAGDEDAWQKVVHVRDNTFNHTMNEHFSFYAIKCTEKHYLLPW